MVNLKSSKWSNLYQKHGSQDSQEENFESLVDLFTLIAMALIIATFISGYQRYDAKSKDLYTILDFSNVKKGQDTPIGVPIGIPIGIPKDTLIVMHTVERTKDLFVLLQSMKSAETIYYSGQKKPLWDSLEENKSAFLAASDIQILVNSRPKKVNPALFYTLAKWLAENKIHAKYNIDDETN